MRECYTRDWATRLYAGKVRQCSERNLSCKVSRVIPAAYFGCEGLSKNTVCWSKESGKAWVGRDREGKAAMAIEERLAAQAARLVEIDRERLKQLDPMAPAVGTSLCWDEAQENGHGVTVTLETSRYQRQVWADNAKFRREHDKARQSSLTEDDKAAQAALHKEAARLERERAKARKVDELNHRLSRTVDVNAILARKAQQVAPGVIRRKLPTRPPHSPPWPRAMVGFLRFGGRSLPSQRPPT